MAPTLYHVPKTISSPIYQALLELDVVDNPVKVVTLSFGDLKSSKHLARNPMGSSPTFVDEERSIGIWESGAVLTYLLEEHDKEYRLHPRPGVASPGDRARFLHVQQYITATAYPFVDRAKFLHVQQYITATAYPFVASLFLHTLKPADEQDPKYIETATGKWKTLLAPTLECFCDGPFFMGDKMSAIDFLVAKPLNNAAAMGVLEEFPKLNKLFQKVKCLPSFAKAYGVEVNTCSECEKRRSMLMLPGGE
eukprot:CAMPEP_0197468790 /NCGR_PEP_ID=MMETSP1175-20131217/66268_1 /TAXON_ID=1003142 /ORGANISM="Triceratium dubium, Strain CCMP147" /LENGTH=250 /DNA_ID=CAMNT_0043004909 /DNA_START=20 /DNA_END=772 /DNA_ORIENTATION=+